MSYAVLGRSGILVSRICLGTMTFGTPTTEAQASKLVGHALDQGVNFFDTSNAYEGYDRTFGSSGGVAEEILGKALKGRRHEAVICTKFANPVGLGPLEAGLSARHLETELEKSLKRLKTDRIDLFLAHRWDARLPVEEVWRVCDRWVRSGKVIAVGISNWPTWRVSQVSEIAVKYGWPSVAASSPLYNPVRRGVELEHVPCATHYNISLIPYQPFAGGIFTGKYRRGQPAAAGTRAAEMPGWVPKIDDGLFDKLEALEALANEMSIPLPQYVIAWVLSRKGVTSTIVGCRTAEQLDSAVAGSEQVIPPEHFAKIDSLFPPPKPHGGEAVLQWRTNAWKLEDIES